MIPLALGVGPAGVAAGSTEDVGGPSGAVGAFLRALLFERYFSLEKISFLAFWN